MLAADVAAVDNGDGLRQDDKEQHRLGADCVSVISSWIGKRFSWDLRSIDAHGPGGRTLCTTCGFTDVRGLSGIICEQVE